MPGLASSGMASALETNEAKDPFFVGTSSGANTGGYKRTVSWSAECALWGQLRSQPLQPLAGFGFWWRALSLFKLELPVTVFLAL